MRMCLAVGTVRFQRQGTYPAPVLNQRLGQDETSTHGKHVAERPSYRHIGDTGRARAQHPLMVGQGSGRASGSRRWPVLPSAIGEAPRLMHTALTPVYLYP